MRFAVGMTNGRSWKVFATAAAAAIGAYEFIPDNPYWVSGWQVSIGYAGVIAILFGVRRLPRRERLPWWCFAFGVFCNVTGIAVAVITATVWNMDDSPTPADPLFLLLYAGCAVGIGVLIRRREQGRRNWAAMVDATTITTGLGLLAWIYVITPAVHNGDTSMLGEAVQIAYPIGDLVLIAMMARLLRTGGTRGASFWWITGSLTAFLTGDTVWVIISNLGDLGYRLQSILWVHRGIDSIFLIAYALFGIAALHSDSRDVATAGGPAPIGLSRLHLTLLTAASLIAPAVLGLQLETGKVTNGMAIVLGSASLFLLVVTRMAQLLREVERQSLQVRELARRDELTGLPNRRAWNDELPRALERARRAGRPVSVALLDLDRFKQFNDTYGHPAGDRLLKSAAAAWCESVRSVDTLARYGGEEFTVLLPDTDADEAQQILQRALTATPLGQTFSAGVVTWDGQETSDELIERADAALYAAKAAGRNQILIPVA
jgi:diguanylate cyclase (GGDEF)-like protein